MNHDFDEIYERNADSVYRVCFMYCKNKSDTEDMTQNTFLKLAEHLDRGRAFESHEHEAAWLIRVAINDCKNTLKSFWNRRVDLSEWESWSEAESREIAYGYSGAYSPIPEPDETLEKLLKLPPKLKTALYLHYYEEYSAAEIAKMMGKPESTVRGYLHRGRNSLKKVIESESCSKKSQQSEQMEVINHGK